MLRCNNLEPNAQFLNGIKPLGPFGANIQPMLLSAARLRTCPSIGGLRLARRFGMAGKAQHRLAPEATTGRPRLFADKFLSPHTGTAVVALTWSSTKLVLQSCTLGCLRRVSMMKRL